MNNKRLISLSLGLLMIAVFVVATWLISAKSSMTAHVISVGQSPVSFTQDFSNISLDTTNNTATSTSTAILNNNNGNLTLTFNGNATKTDVADNCNNYNSDCQVNYSLEGIGSITSGQSFNMNNGNKTINTTVTCARLSCPQDIFVNVTIIQ